MDGYGKRAEDYRQKAEELRTMMSDFKDEYTPQILEEIAAGYDNLAMIQERLAKSSTFKV